MQIAQDKVVLIHYTLTNDKGEVIDSSSGGDPLAYLHGQGNIIPGLEKALEGKQAGDKLDVKVAPADGYGERDDKLVQQVPRRSSAARTCSRACSSTPRPRAATRAWSR
jgi:FKBP-type peptidyl-prolyl cis-trans isomerase SlyD